MTHSQMIHVHSLNDTKALAHRLALLVSKGDVITLEGQLGAGKTAFTKALAEGLGVKEHVTSPTFTIVKEYSGVLPLYHMDAYRLEDAEDDIGFEEYFYGDGVTVIEWAQFITDFLPAERLEITIKYINEHERELHVHPIGKHYVHMVEQLLRY